MRILPLLALCLLAGCAAKPEARPVVSVGNRQIQAGVVAAPYERGVSTEAQMIAARGQPQSRSVSADGIVTDIYVADGISLTNMQRPGPDGKVVSFADLAAALGPDKKAEFVVRNHYVYSPDGILQKIILDFPDIGPNGEVIHHLEDTAGMKIQITGRHKVDQ